MNDLEIAKLKDSILNHLSLQNRAHIQLKQIYRELNLKNIPIEVVEAFVQEMLSEGEILTAQWLRDRTMLMLTDKGRKLLFEGGYTKRIEKEIQAIEQKKVDSDNYRYKTDLEIINLKASLNHYGETIKHYRCTRTVSILAIILSLLSLIASIFL